MKVVVHNGVVWAYRISGGWYTHLRAFPEAGGNINHPVVKNYVGAPSYV